MGGLIFKLQRLLPLIVTDTKFSYVPPYYFPLMKNATFFLIIAFAVFAMAFTQDEDKRENWIEQKWRVTFNPHTDIPKGAVYEFQDGHIKVTAPNLQMFGTYRFSGDRMYMKLKKGGFSKPKETVNKIDLTPFQLYVQPVDEQGKPLPYTEFALQSIR